jgi:hypothetical protein
VLAQEKTLSLVTKSKCGGIDASVGLLAKKTFVVPKKKQGEKESSLTE